MHPPLGKLVHIRTGHGFRSGIRHEDDGDVAVLQIKDIKQTAEIDPSVLPRMRWAQLGSPLLLREGDIVLPARGEHYAAVMVRTDAPLLASSQLYVLQVRDQRLLPDYLCAYLNQSSAQAYIQKHLTGSSIPMLRLGALSMLPVPVPTLAAQRRIAELDRLLQHEQGVVARLLETRRQILDSVFRPLLNA